MSGLASSATQVGADLGTVAFTASAFTADCGFAAFTAAAVVAVSTALLGCSISALTTGSRVRGYRSDQDRPLMEWSR